MAEIEEIYASNLDDILYAIAQRLSSGSVTMLVDMYPVLVTNDARTVTNYPALIGASKVIVFMGGTQIGGEVIEGRYYLVNTTTEEAAGLQPGDIDLPNMVAGEIVLILKS